MVELRIDGSPRDNDTHTWSDFVELLALVNLDSVCTMEFALDRIHDSPSEMDSEDGIGDDEESDSSSVSAMRERDRALARLADAFALCSWRSQTYGEKYPFVVDCSVREISLIGSLSEAHYSYLFLLLCGNLPFVKSGRNSLTDGFEKFCSGVFKDLLPHGSEVHIFGKVNSARYKGTKLEKFLKLATDIRGRCHREQNDFRVGDQGDGGIDLVGWHELKDGISNIPVSFGQCACSREEWVKKQAEVMPEFLSTDLTSFPNWMPFVFLPLCFRESGGEWAVKGEVKSVVLLDRLRIINNCLDYMMVNNISGARSFVANVSASEALV